MSFREVLRSLVSNVDGALGAILMGYDGISIDECISENSDTDISLLAIEYTPVLKDVRQTVEVLNSGEIEELSLTTDRSRLIFRVVNDEFFVVLVLSVDGNFGKGRYLLKRSIPALLEML